MTIPATEMAAANAKVAHGGFTHGDNDPDATAELRRLFGIGGLVDQAEPRKAEEIGRVMCKRWGGPSPRRSSLPRPQRRSGPTPAEFWNAYCEMKDKGLLDTAEPGADVTPTDGKGGDS